MLGHLVTLTGWSFVAASACVFVAVAVLVHGAFDFVERRRHLVRDTRLEHAPDLPADRTRNSTISELVRTSSERSSFELG